MVAEIIFMKCEMTDLNQQDLHEFNSYDMHDKMTKKHVRVQLGLKELVLCN